MALPRYALGMNVNRNRRIGDTLRKIRVEAHLTQSEVAVKLGKPQSFVAKIESGERSLHVAELFDYARALNSDAYVIICRLSATLALDD